MEDFSDYSAPELVKMLGSRFKEYRLRANMTQKEVAEMAGLSVLSVYRFENGTVTNISLSTFLLLMKAVGCINDLNDIRDVVASLKQFRTIATKYGVSDEWTGRVETTIIDHLKAWGEWKEDE